MTRSLFRLVSGWLLLALAPAVGIPVGYHLLMIHVESNALFGINNVCGVSCSEVAASAYSKIAGIPLPVIGMAWFAGLAAVSVALLLVWLLGKAPTSGAADGDDRETPSSETPSAETDQSTPPTPPLTGIFLVFLYGLGVLASFALLLISLIAIESLCGWCAIIYAANVAGLAGAWLVVHRGPFCATGTMIRRAGQMLVHPATIGFVLVAAGSGAAAEMRHRVLVEQFHQANVLATRLIGTKIEHDIHNPDAPAVGPDDAAIEFVVFIEYGCPHCQQLVHDLLELQRDYGARMRVEVRNYVSDNLDPKIRDGARYTALASICASREPGGYLRFFEMIWEKRQAAIDIDAIRSNLGRYGFDASRIHACTLDPATVRAFHADNEFGRRIQLRHLPTFFINRVWQIGAKPIDELRGMIEAELLRSAYR